jgi:hypothetical protein
VGTASAERSRFPTGAKCRSVGARSRTWTARPSTGCSPVELLRHRGRERPFATTAPARIRTGGRRSGSLHFPGCVSQGWNPGGPRVAHVRSRQLLPPGFEPGSRPRDGRMIATTPREQEDPGRPAPHVRSGHGQGPGESRTTSRRSCPTRAARLRGLRLASFESPEEAGPSRPFGTRPRTGGESNSQPAAYEAAALPLRYRSSGRRGACFGAGPPRGGGGCHPPDPGNRSPRARRPSAMAIPGSQRCLSRRHRVAVAGRRTPDGCGRRPTPGARFERASRPRQSRMLPDYTSRARVPRVARGDSPTRIRTWGAAARPPRVFPLHHGARCRGWNLEAGEEPHVVRERRTPGHHREDRRSGPDLPSRAVRPRRRRRTTCAWHPACDRTPRPRPGSTRSLYSTGSTGDTLDWGTPRTRRRRVRSACRVTSTGVRCRVSCSGHQGRW